MRNSSFPRAAWERSQGALRRELRLTYRKLRGFPSSGLGTRMTKLQLRETGSWSFPH